MNILVVIPARGGSKGIPRKNIRLMNGKPLIFYSINNGKNCNNINDVVVTSDDNEIISVAKSLGCDIIERDKSLAEDEVTLDPVIYDAVQKMESFKNRKYDVIVTLQATSPLLKQSTLEDALNKFLNSNIDTMISVVNKPHLSWGKNKSGFFPCYKERLNRQMLPDNYLETGAFLISKRECVKKNSRIGNKVSVYEMPENESIDIDSTQDWIICESELKKKKIVFRADGYKKLGMGHIYRIFTLIYSLTGQDILIVTKKEYKEGLEKIKESNLPYRTIENDNEFFEILREYKPDIIVNDCLDTKRDYIIKLKQFSKRVITFEDLGEGAEEADAVINALYDCNFNRKNIYSGEKYICLRDEFLVKSIKEFSPKVNNILILFGGTDPSNLTLKLYNLAKKIHSVKSNIKFTFIIGTAYDTDKNKIYEDIENNIFIIKDTKRVSDYMACADMAITSQGRTVFELAHMGVPSIVLAQNEREMLHKFANMANGFLNLGLGSKVSDETLNNTILWLINTPEIRKEMYSLMKKHELKNGIDRVKKIILGEML